MPTSFPLTEALIRWKLLRAEMMKCVEELSNAQRAGDRAGERIRRRRLDGLAVKLAEAFTTFHAEADTLLHAKPVDDTVPEVEGIEEAAARREVIDPRR